jgi:soluble lytic murein transglycosylase
MSDEGRLDPTWNNWLAQARLGMQNKPLPLGLATPSDFLTLPIATKPSEQDMAIAKANQGLRRALYAIHLGLRSEGVREWNYEINLARGRMGDNERIAAAALACEAEVWDRCINTSEGTKNVIVWSQRYPTPYRELLVEQADKAKVDPAFAYGLIRQESRFVTDASSSVGAAGLMQLMPATAKWTAKHIGLANYSHGKINDVNTNLLLGVSYLKYVLDQFDGDPVLAAAAYNAGPNRVRSWQAAMAQDPAAKSANTQLAQDIWIENIPFAETRNYVKKVSANTEAYRQVLTSPDKAKAPTPIQ